MIKNFLKHFFLALAVTSLVFHSLGQDLSSLAQKALKEGYSIEQLEQIARQNGLSLGEIEQLKSQVSSVQSDQSVISPIRQQPVILEPVRVKQIPNASSEDENKVFGNSIFRTVNLSFTPNLNIPTPENYILGPGDIINVELWGKSEVTISLTVRPDGFIKPENLGPIYVNGLSIDKARKLLKTRLSRIYQGLNSTLNQPASTFALITLGQIRSINVMIVGEVQLPGEYTLNSLSTVYTALHACGGPSNDGTLREVELIRDGKSRRKIDIYSFLINGIKSDDLVLRQNDVIVVKPYLSRVLVEGEFKKTGYFELKENETLTDLMTFTGGFTNQANDDKILIERIADSGIELMEIEVSNSDNFPIISGDIVSVMDRNDLYTNRVFIEGAINQPGRYELTPKMMLKELILKAKGVRGDAFNQKVFIYRLKDNFEQELITLNLQDVIDDKEDAELMPDDIVEVKSLFGLTQEPYFKISGELQKPGIYPYIENTTISDLIQFAGGLKFTANPVLEITRILQEDKVNLAYKIKRLDLEDSTSLNFELLPFDQIHVKRKPGSFNEEAVIIGEVKSPGRMSIISENERLSSIIERAGGLTINAYPKGAILIRRNELYQLSDDIKLYNETLENIRYEILQNAGADLYGKSDLSSRKDNIAIFTESSSRATVNKVNSSLKISIIDSLDSSRSAQFEVVAIDFEEVLEKPGSPSDLFVKAGDIISIPPELQTVRVTGEVNNNVILKYDKGKNYKQYVNDSGGFNSSASKKYSTILYPNGRKAKVSRFLFFKYFPPVEPGATIIVGTKKTRRSFNINAALGTTISTIGSVVGIALLIQRL